LPPEVIPYLHWDLSPMRPWEWWQMDAEAWTEAVEVQEARRMGVEDANAEKD